VSNLQTFIFVISFGLIAIVAKEIGSVFSRLKLPYITGYLFTGMITGPFVLDFLPTEATAHLRFIDELSLAVIAFVAGSEMYLREMRSRLKSIAWVTIGLTVAVLTLGTVAVLVLADYVPFMSEMSTVNRIAVAILASTILAARSPSSAIAVINELRAKGPYTKTVLGVTILLDVVVIVLFAISVSISHILLTGLAINLMPVLKLVTELMAAATIGFIASKLLEFTLASHLHKRIKTTLILLIGFSIFTLSSEMGHFTHENLPFEISAEPLLASLIASIIITNYSSHRIEFMEILHDVRPVIYIAFFTLTGVSLKLDILFVMLPVALILFVVRTVGIIIGSFAGGVMAGDPKHQNSVLWMGFVTQAGVALGLARGVAVEFPSFGDEFATMIISVVVLNEIVGPLLLKIAIERVGEAHLPGKTNPDELREALILGIDDQSLALARLMQAHNWRVILADTNLACIEGLATEDVDERHIPSVSEMALSELITKETDAIVGVCLTTVSRSLT
jgi:Kef-type K+ transport system membrane component KefB